MPVGVVQVQLHPRGRGWRVGVGGVGVGEKGGKKLKIKKCSLGVRLGEGGGDVVCVCCVSGGCV